MATKTRVDGRALQIINSIKLGEPDELNVRRFSRLAGMLKGEQIAWRVLEDHGKANIVKEARERLAEASRKLKNPDQEGENA